MSWYKILPNQIFTVHSMGFMEPMMLNDKLDTSESLRCYYAARVEDWNILDELLISLGAVTEDASHWIEVKLLCSHFPVHHIMVVKEERHGLSIYAEKEPEDHISHLKIDPIQMNLSSCYHSPCELQQYLSIIGDDRQNFIILSFEELFTTLKSG